MTVSFALFGTLVTADGPADPAEAIARELRARGVGVPDDWADAYRDARVEAPDGAEVPLPSRVGRALANRDVIWDDNAVRRAVVAAFDPEVETRPGAVDAVDAAREHGPVAICANCTVPELVARTLARSELDRDAFDAVVTSAGCGWRKPAPGIFETTADRLGIDADALVHVGTNPATDGGVETVGGTWLSLEETPLRAIPATLDQPE